MTTTTVSRPTVRKVVRRTAKVSAVTVGGLGGVLMLATLAVLGYAAVGRAGTTHRNCTCISLMV
jgi:hypothetical protein